MRIILVDDNPDMLEAALESIPKEYEVAGVYQNGLSMLENAPALDPDVIILDLSMPGINGFEVARQLKHLQIRAKLIFFTIHMGEDYIQAAFDVGASGYVFKSRLAADLPAAIKAVVEGKRFTSLDH